MHPIPNKGTGFLPSVENTGRLRLFIEQVPGAVAMFDRAMGYIAARYRWLVTCGLEGLPKLAHGGILFLDEMENWARHSSPSCPDRRDPDAGPPAARPAGH